MNALTGWLYVAAVIAVLWGGERIYRRRAPHKTCRHCHHPVLHHNSAGASEHVMARYDAHDCVWCSDCAERRHEGAFQ